MNSLSSIRTSFFTPILLYHSTFSNLPIELKDNVHNVKPETLYKQLTWLKNQYDFVFVDELLQEPTARGRCAVTFDDAYFSVFEESLSVLSTLNIPSTIFINSSSFDGRLFWRDQVRYLLNHNLVSVFLKEHTNFCSSKGINKENFYRRSKHRDVNSEDFTNELDLFFLNHRLQDKIQNYLVSDTDDLILSPLIMYGNHTHNHHLLSSLDCNQQKEQIHTCDRFLIKSVPKNHISKVFSIPFGGEKSISAFTMNEIKTLGYQAALMSRNRLNMTSKIPNYKVEDYPVFERFMPVDDFKSFTKQFFRLKLRSVYDSVYDKLIVDY